MNCNIYVYGDFEKGYTQYPDNYTQTIIKGVISKVKNQGECQIAICRNGDLVYLIYNYKYNANKSFGFCLEYNKVCPRNINYIFDFFNSIIADILNKGKLLHYTTLGNILPTSYQLYEHSAIIDNYSDFIHLHLDDKQAQFRQLPPINRGIDYDRAIVYQLQDSSWSVETALNGFNTIIITKNMEENGIYSYKNVLKELNKEIANLHQENKNLKNKNYILSSKLTKAKVQQRNLIWVSVLGAIALILGVVVWNKVLFPSEVTRYQTEYFLYYGPMQNKRPHGEGVAFYPKDDQDGRRYYIGYFVNGERQDSTAMLYYQNGDYFYGSMDGDKFLKGIFYSNSDKSHFEGSFVDNKPYDGTWYNHEESYKLKDGEMK